MKAQIVSILVAAVCFVSVSGQAKQAANTTSTAAGPPPAVKTAIQKLQADVQQMKSAGNIDQTKIFQDVQDIVDAAKAGYPNPSPAIQDKINAIQTTINQAKASGKVEPQQIKTIVQAIHALVGGKPGDKPGNGPAKLG